MSRSSAFVGIDLGTTYSLVATLQSGAPIVLPNSLGEPLTPSAVSVADDGSVLVGAAARARATTHPEQTVLGFKRDMGTSTTYRLGKRTFTPQELSALVLGALKADAEAALGMPIEEAVVTVPAYFGEAQRRATRGAAEIAGLFVERIVNEPTAAALAYGLHQMDRDLRAVVLDLGGGTFDVTVVELTSGIVEISSSAGDAKLGGDDFDEALAQHFSARIGREHGIDVERSPEMRARIRAASEDLKKRLTGSMEAKLPLLSVPAGRGKTIDLELSLSRSEAEAIWAPLLDRIRLPIRRAMGDARRKTSDIDEVLLVGGSSRMPCFVELAAKLFGRLPQRSLPPDEAVALGAAVQAALKRGDEAVSEMVVTDIAPFTLGIAIASVVGRDHVHGLFSPVIDRGTVIPTSRVQRFYPIDEMQTHINVEIYQGERSLCRDNEKLGELKVSGLNQLRREANAVDVRFTYDGNGILEVEAVVVATGKVATLVIERGGGHLSDSELGAAREAMKRLKLHPRDALPNTTALSRADALFIELTGPERALLGDAIATFLAAIESQEPSSIERGRAHLVATTASLRSGR